MWSQEGKIGRCWMGRIPYRGDLLLNLEKFAEQENIRAGWVEVIGAASKAVLGFYNQQEHKYINREIEEELEILNCLGNISLREGKPAAHLHITLENKKGQVKGGHLLPGTIVFAGEYVIWEILGPDLHRTPDKNTGLPLWDQKK